jgi:chemotaxis response regulator CheB
MTGANDDGSRGLRRIADRGGKAIVQDPTTADSQVMPAAALRAVPNADVVKLDEIGAYIGRLVLGGDTAERRAKRAEREAARAAARAANRDADRGMAS